MTPTQRTEPPTHLTVADLATRWHTSAQAIYNMRHRRKGPRGFRRGKEILYPLTEVEAYEAAAMAEDSSNPENDPTRAAVEPARVRRTRKTAATAQVAHAA
jgi:hypothetical protein